MSNVAKTDTVQPMKIATWNVNSVTMRQARVVEFLKRESPDFLCLQELKCLDEKFPKDVFEGLGYHCATFGQKTYNGVAILSREKPTEVVRGFCDEEDDPAARMIEGTFSKLSLLCLYVPNGQQVGSPAYEYKLRWLNRLRSYLDRRHKSSSPVVLVGDFNVAPDDRDVHDPAAWRDQILFSEPEKAALKKVTDFGLSDTFRMLHSEGGHYSWWDYRALGFPMNKGLRIDLIYASTPLIKKCIAARIDRNERKGEKPSDHAPVIAEFK